MIYYIPLGFEPKVQPHGNSKAEKPFYPTLPSTMKALARYGPGGPKQVISDVSVSIGGVRSAYDACSLPRNEQQVTNLRRRQSKPSLGAIVSCTTDELAVVMQKAFVEDDNNSFIREMKTLKEPAIIVALERQLDDFVKFCTSDTKFGIVTIDPTFSLGEFDVTVTTYRHLVLQCKRSCEHPVFIGPVMIHYKKSFATYLFFASTLLGLRPQLSHLKCFGTDDEQALHNAFLSVFPSAVHLLCSLHMRRSLKMKLRDLNVGESLQKVVIDDIFRKQVATHKVEGLLDAETDEEFDEGFILLSNKWESLDSHADGPLHLFGAWLSEYKTALMKKTMSRTARCKAGLGDPPRVFTTNASESINSVLKNKVDYKKNDLPVFLDKLKSVINEQEREMERAIIGRGKYQLSEGFKKLEKTEHQWFSKMSLAQRQSHIKRVLSATVESKAAAPRSASLSKAPSSNPTLVSKPTAPSLSKASSSNSHLLSISRPHFSKPIAGQLSDKPTCSRQLFSQSYSALDTVELSVDVHQFSSSVLIPRAVLDAIWAKAKELINDVNAICNVPGGSPKDRIVKSSSGPRPHVVSAKKSGQYACECPNWKSMGLCSHSVATAQVNGDLDVLIEWVKKAKKAPNITKLTTATMPKGRGRKGCSAPPKKKKKVVELSRKSFADVLKDQSKVDLPTKSSDNDATGLGSQQSEAFQPVSSSTRPLSSDFGVDQQPLSMYTSSRSRVGDVQLSVSAQGSATRLSFSGGECSSSYLPPPLSDETDSLQLQSEPFQPVSSDSNSTSSSNIGIYQQPFNKYSSSHSRIGDVELNVTAQGSATRLAFSGGECSSRHLPPPLVPCSPAATPFDLSFVCGNISVCRGCRLKYPKPPTPPMDLCIRHREWLEFLSPFGVPQKRFGNAYYHCSVPCVQSRCPEFEPSMLQIPPAMAMQLMPVHTEYLATKIPGRL